MGQASSARKHAWACQCSHKQDILDPGFLLAHAHMQLRVVSVDCMLPVGKRLSYCLCGIGASHFSAPVQRIVSKFNNLSAETG